MKKTQTKTPYSEENRLKWESNLIDSVITYIKAMNTIVNPTQIVYIAVDGVAPMAKIRQQRVRRFKSAIQAEEEGRIRAQAKGIPYVAKERWDTNSITPGTKFMEKLSIELRKYAKTNPKKIIVSPADEPGEGEQKIMDYLRQSTIQDAVIYGLDADLIVLSLYAFAKQNIQVDLFREEVEINGMIKEDSSGKESYLYLRTDILSDALFSEFNKKQTKQEFLIDFVALMSILGNDFVPHGMALKIRDEGIEKILAIYKTIQQPLLENDTYNQEALKVLFRNIQEKEATWLLKNVKSKLKARIGFSQSRNAEDIALAKQNDLPVEWAAEACLVEDIQVEGYEKPHLALKPDWKEIYDKEALWGSEPEEAAKIYLEALSWTFAYYSGKPVDTYWYYPWLLPPRAETILKVLDQKTTQIPITVRPIIKPLEQLAMVLPMSSFTLLPQEYRGLEKNHPYAWPVAWKTYSFGRRFLWECEPLIPLIQPPQMKKWIEELYEE